MATYNCDRFHCYFRPWTIKYDSSGTLLWSRLLYEGYWRPLPSYKGVACDSNGDLYIAMGLRGVISDFWPWSTRKLTSDGGYAWVLILNESHAPEGVMGMFLDQDAKVYYAGTEGGGFESHKVTSEGTNIWKARYQPWLAGAHRANAITADGEGNAYVTGQSAGVGTGNDYATIKYGTNGQQLWVKRYTEGGNSDDQAHAIAVAPNGDVYVTGFSNPSPGTYEITTIKYVQVAPIEKKSNDNVVLSLCGAPGSNYLIEASTTLSNWTGIGSTTANSNGLYTFEDTNAPAFQQRFYRAKPE